MLATLSTIIRFMTLTVLLEDYLRRNHLQKYESFLFFASYNLFNLYSKGQILFNNVFAKFKSFIESNPKLKKLYDDICKSKKTFHEIEHIKNGEQICLYNKDNNDFTDKFNECDAEFLIFSDYSKINENYCINKKIIINKPISFDYGLTDFKFLLVEFIIGENVYKINLKDEKYNYNYYIIDNVFDINFFTYYLTHHYHEICSKEDYDITKYDNCVVKIVDHNVKTISVDMKKNSSIKILKDGYVINMKKTEIIEQ
jgi:hypothetical protein